MTNIAESTAFRSKLPQVKVVYKVVLALYLLLLLWLILFKFSLDLSLVVNDHARTLNLIPFVDIPNINLQELIFNLVIFVPLGLLFGTNLKRTVFWHQFALLFALSLAVETIQFVFAIGIADITDVITNTTGGLLGLVLYGLGSMHITGQKLDRLVAIGSGALLTMFLFVFLSGFLRFPSTDRPESGMQLEGRSIRQ